MLYIGLMSGTSMDAVDAALVDIANGHIRLIAYHQYPITPELRQDLKSITGSSSIDFVSRLDVRTGRFFAEAASSLLRENNRGSNEIAAIGSHGQTILHRPEPPEPASLQIGDPNLIARLTGITTIADFRRMDMAAGGQGAPLTPALHEHLFSHETINRVIVNIGGVANITILPARETGGSVYGFDTGPGNVLLDEWAFLHTGQAMDKNGVWGASGCSNEKLLRLLLQDGYFSLEPPKSTGRDYFNLPWLQTYLEKIIPALPPQDVQATLVQLTAVSITSAISKFASATTEVIVAGGGTHNPQLMLALSKYQAKASVISTRELGVDPDALEAIAFAWLAKCRIEKQPGNLTSVTGATAQVPLGCIYEPGNTSSGS